MNMFEYMDEAKNRSKNSRRGGDTIKRRETIYLPADVAEALRRASLAAGGYGEKTRIAAESIRAHPEVRAQLEKMRREGIVDA